MGKPSKYDVKPLQDGRAPEYSVVTAAPDGTAQSLHPRHEQRIREIVNSFSADKFPKNGIIVLAPADYNKIREQIQRGYILNKRIQQTPGSTEHWGALTGASSRLGDGFTIPQAGATYINGALLDDDKKLQEVLAHELGHYAADPDGTEPAADAYKDAYLQRGQQTQKVWNDATHIPARGLQPLMGEK